MIRFIAGFVCGVLAFGLVALALSFCLPTLPDTDGPPGPDLRGPRR